MILVMTHHLSHHDSVCQLVLKTGRVPHDVAGSKQESSLDDPFTQNHELFMKFSKATNKCLKSVSVLREPNAWMGGRPGRVGQTVKIGVLAVTSRKLFFCEQN